MKLLLTTSRAGERISQPAGTIIDVPEDEARRLLAARQAQRLDATPEQAMVTPLQTAMQPHGRPREVSHRRAK